MKNLKARGIEFLDIPDEYYNILRKKLSQSGIQISEDLKILQVHNKKATIIFHHLVLFSRN